MRFSTYLNNVKCMEWKINAQQGVLVDTLFQISEKMETEIVNGEKYYHITKERIIEEIPMFFSEIDTIYRNLKLLHEKNIIKYMKKKKRDYIKITEKGKEWLKWNTL